MKNMNLIRKWVFFVLTAGLVSACYGKQPAPGGREVSGMASELCRRVYVSAIDQEEWKYEVVGGRMNLVADSLAEELLREVEACLLQHETSRVGTGLGNLMRWDYEPDLRVSLYEGGWDSRDTLPEAGRRIYSVFADFGAGQFHIVEHRGKKVLETRILDLDGHAGIARMLGELHPGQTGTEEVPANGRHGQGEFMTGLRRMKLEAAYLLDPMKENGGAVVRSFAVIDTSLAVSKPLEERVKGLLASETTYDDSGLADNCTFLPDIAWTFVRDGRRTEVLVSFYCGKMMVACGEKEFFLKFSPKMHEVLECAIACFPEDRYLKRYRP